jgi:hypothetical protein
LSRWWDATRIRRNRERIRKGRKKCLNEIETVRNTCKQKQKKTSLFKLGDTLTFLGVNAVFLCDRDRNAVVVCPVRANATRSAKLNFTIVFDPKFGGVKV